MNQSIVKRPHLQPIRLHIKCQFNRGEKALALSVPPDFTVSLRILSHEAASKNGKLFRLITGIDSIPD
jgi:hypothetical protein